VSYPKSGSTWARFLFTHALTGRETDFDAVRDVVPPLARKRRAPELLGRGGRLLRSHEPLRWFHAPAGTKVVYLVRDGREIAASYLRHLRREGRYGGPPHIFVSDFVRGRVDGYGSWVRHVTDATDATRRGILLVRYEELRRSTESELQRVLEYLGVDVPSEAVRAAVLANSKERMRSKEASSVLLRERSVPGAASFVQPDDVEPWHAMFDPSDVERLTEALRPGLATLGYPLDAGPPARSQ
jgi:hypothetical protein